MRLWMLLPMLVACAPTARLSSPRLLDPGAVQATAGTSLQLVAAGPAEFGVLEAGVGARVGIVESVEAGLQVRGFYTNVVAMLGTTLELKWQLLRAPSETSGVDLALAPSVTYQWLTGSGASGHQLGLALPLLMGLRVGDGHQIIAAPTVIDQISIASGASTVHQPFFGTSLGFLWQLDDAFALLPEAGMFWSPVGIEGSTGVGLITFQIGALFSVSRVLTPG